jgi:hypothetical protein
LVEIFGLIPVVSLLPAVGGDPTVEGDIEGVDISVAWVSTIRFSRSDVRTHADSARTLAVATPRPRVHGATRYPMRACPVSRSMSCRAMFPAYVPFV